MYSSEIKDSGGLKVKKRKTRVRRKRREGLVFQHLERVSRRLLEQHPDIVRQFIGRNAGIYALYDKDKLYYVGLTSGLSGRLKAHLRNRHEKAWDNFSIYLVNNNHYMRGIESLLLQIADPKGNKVGGKPPGSKDMLRMVRKEIRRKLAYEADALIGRRKVLASKPRAETQTLKYLLPRGAELKGVNRKLTYRARLLKNGMIRYEGILYSSVSKAASVALKRPANGWWFWRAQRAKGHWVTLREVRRAGTPL
jgi:hypothetical protein